MDFPVIVKADGYYDWYSILILIAQLVKNKVEAGFKICIVHDSDTESKTFKFGAELDGYKYTVQKDAVRSYVGRSTGYGMIMFTDTCYQGALNIYNAVQEYKVIDPGFEKRVRIFDYTAKRWYTYEKIRQCVEGAASV